MATDVLAPGAGEPEGRRPSRAEAASGGFFTIYKSGQGYWTRLGTGIGGGLILVLVLHFLYTTLPPWIQPSLTPANATNDQIAQATATARKITIGICAVSGIGLGILGWWLMNKPSNADFLIATDSEMKKVNWTSRKDLIGSTKVVILFMFMIAAFLFLVDVLFGYLFYFIRVLKTPPF